MDHTLHMMTASALVESFRAGRLSPVEVAQAVLDRVDAVNGTYNAFCVLDAERTLADAKASEDRWWRGEPIGLIDGVPSTIKDLMLSEGWPTRRGSKTIDPDQNWDADTPCVARMREQGAVFIGKTTTPEFGWKGVTDSPLTGSTRNPWNPERTAGGSSGGAGVATALGMGALNIGSDGGGSIRMPAGFCGIFGIKPTFGVVPAWPQSTMNTLSHHGPMTRTVTDAALMLTVMSGGDTRDWYAPPPPAVDFRDDLDSGIAGCRIAYSRTLGYADVDPAIIASVDQAVAVLASLGAIVEEVDPGFENPLDAMVTLWSTGCALGVDATAPEKRSLMDGPLLELAERGRATSAVDYRKAENVRLALGEHMAAFHQNYDFLVTPQLSLTAFESGKEFPDNRGYTRWWDWSPFTYPFNMTQQPGATVPCGFDSDGLPISFQIIGAKFRDREVLQAARAYERVNPFPMPKVD